MNWDKHYTGIETAQLNWASFNLYFNRRTKTQKLEFIRLSRKHRMLGVFLDHVNMLPGYQGWEVFTSNFGFGWCSGELKHTERVKWGGSMNKPYSHVGVRVWRFGFVWGHIPQWIQERKSRKDQAKWEAAMAAYDDEVTHYYEEGGESC